MIMAWFCVFRSRLHASPLTASPGAVGGVCDGGPGPERSVGEGRSAVRPRRPPRQGRLEDVKKVLTGVLRRAYEEWFLRWHR